MSKITTTRDHEDSEKLLPTEAPSLDDRPQTGPRNYDRCVLMIRQAVIIIVVGTALLYLIPIIVEACMDTTQSESISTTIPRPKVALEAHIMSKCPDARDCLRDLVVPAMANISDEVSFTLSYIGKNTEHDESVECMHGQSECLGNIIELCAADLYPDPKIYLGFANCMTLNYTQIPQEELVHDCSLEHGISFDGLNECMSKDDGAFGMDLLRNSVARSANAGVTKSCTIRINDKIRCIRDGAQWKDCEGGSTPEDLVRDVRALG